MNTVKVETPRLIIRGFVLDDALALSRILSDSRVMQFSLGATSNEETIQLIKTQLSILEKEGLALYAILHKELNALIGYVGFVNQEIDGNQYVELGYRIDHNYWGQGYGVEASKRMLEYAFKELNLTNIVSIIDPKNQASLRVAEKIGMRRQHSILFEERTVDLYQVKHFQKETANLSLRELQYSDVQHLRPLLESKEVMLYEENICTSPNDIATFITTQRAAYKNDQTGLLGIWLQSKLIGLIGISTQIMWHEAEVLFQVYLVKEERGNGYANEATKAYFSTLPKTVFQNNVVSIIPKDASDYIDFFGEMSMFFSYELSWRNTPSYCFSLSKEPPYATQESCKNYVSFGQ